MGEIRPVGECPNGRYYVQAFRGNRYNPEIPDGFLDYDVVPLDGEEKPLYKGAFTCRVPASAIIHTKNPGLTVLETFDYVSIENGMLVHEEGTKPIEEALREIFEATTP